jgi:hypothetical protein
VVRITASQTTMCPGIYYVRLMKDYVAPDDNAYQFRATDWTTGDANRVSASNITYDKDKNIIHVNAGTGANNVALMMKYQDVDYTIDQSQVYLVVRGTNLSTADGKSYLWWLNGSNHGSQVKPTMQKTITIDNISQTVFAWDMSKSGLYENFTGMRPSVCVGQTIFGLTSTTGKSDIYDINFTASVDDYLAQTTAIGFVGAGRYGQASAVYDLQGRRRDEGHKQGVVIANGRKVIE